MKTFKLLLALMFLLVFFNNSFAQNTVSWDFENGNDHGFTFTSLIPALPADDDPATAGDESLTGVGGDDGLPFAGVAWSVGVPNMYDGLFPAVEEGCHIDAATGFLTYADCNDPFGVFRDSAAVNYTNLRGQSGYLGTYHLNQWGDGLNSEFNDQMATSPPVKLGEGAELTVWTIGNTDADWAGVRIAPEFDDLGYDLEGYTTGSGGIAVLGSDGSLLTSLLMQAESGDSAGMPHADTLDLSAFAGQEVTIEVVDAFEGGWGWYAIDEIRISNSGLITDVEEVDIHASIPKDYRLSQNYPNPFNPSTKISFKLPQSGFTTLSVYNLLGENVSTLVSKELSAGSYAFEFDASELSSGIYFYQLDSGNFSAVKKMMVIK